MDGITRKTAKDRLLDIAALGLAIGLWATPCVVPPCSHELLTASGASVPMRCHWCFQGQSLLAIGAVLVVVVGGLAGIGEARRSSGVFLALLGIMAVSITQSWAIGLCGRSEMACHTTAHWTWLWAGLLVGVGGLIWNRRGQRRQREAVVDPWDSSADGKAVVR